MTGGCVVAAERCIPESVEQVQSTNGKTQLESKGISNQQQGLAVQDVANLPSAHAVLPKRLWKGRNDLTDAPEANRALGGHFA